jgi:predicted amino acid dehydrogenase
MSSANTSPIFAAPTVTSTAGASTAAGTAVEGLGSFESIVLLYTTASVGGGTLDVYVQTRHGAVWYDYVHFPQIAAGAAAVTYRVPCTRSASVGAPVVIGSGVLPALAVNACVQGDFGDAVRLVVVAGAGAVAGGVQTVNISGAFPTH